MHPKQNCKMPESQFKHSIGDTYVTRIYSP